MAESPSSPQARFGLPGGSGLPPELRVYSLERQRASATNTSATHRIKSARSATTLRMAERTGLDFIRVSME